MLKRLFLANCFFNQKSQGLNTFFWSKYWPWWVFLVLFIYCLSTFCLHNRWINTFLRSLVSANLWNILFPCPGTFSNLWIILEQVSRLVVTFLFFYMDHCQMDSFYMTLVFLLEMNHAPGIFFLFSTIC